MGSSGLAPQQHGPGRVQACGPRPPVPEVHLGRFRGAALERTLARYINGTIEAAQVILELIELAKEMRDAPKRGDDLGCTLRESAQVPPDFERFWECYPRKVGRRKALGAWAQSEGKRPAIEQLIGRVEAQASSAQWMEGVIPNPSTWLDEQRWEDELPRASTRRTTIEIDPIRKAQIAALD